MREGAALLQVSGVRLTSSCGCAALFLALFGLAVSCSGLVLLALQVTISTHFSRVHNKKPRAIAAKDSGGRGWWGEGVVVGGGGGGRGWWWEGVVGGGGHF
jgi:hypothetical protein